MSGLTWQVFSVLSLNELECVMASIKKKKIIKPIFKFVFNFALIDIKKKKKNNLAFHRDKPTWMSSDF